MSVLARALGWDAGGLRRGAKAPGGRGLGMTSNSMALVAAKVATMGLGFAFWLVAARWFTADQVGLAAGAVSAMMLCTQIALLGAGSAFIALFPRHAAQPSRLTDTSFTLVAGVAFLAGGIFLVLAQGAFAELGTLAGKPVFTLLFLAMVVFGTLGILLDQAFTVLRRGDQALWRNLMAGALMLAGVAVFAAAPGMTSATAIFATWVLAGGAACALGTRQLGWALGGWRLRPRIDRAMSREIVAVGVPNHLLTLADRAPALILPIIVVEQLSPAEGAHWYTAWMMAWIIFIVPVQVGMTLFAESAHRSRPLNELVRHGLRTSLPLGIAAAAALCLAAPLVLSLLGADYAEAGTTPLRILVWAVIPMSFIQAYFATCRGTGRLRQATLIAAGSGVVTVVAATLAAPAHGLTGIAVTWLVVQATTGALCLILLRSVARREPAEGHAVVDEAPEPTRGRRPIEALRHATRPRLQATRRPRASRVDPATAALLASLPSTGSERRVAAITMALALAPLVGAVALWATCLQQVDVHEMSDLGLVSVLPTRFFVALGLLGAGFAFNLTRPQLRTPVLLLYTAMLIVVVYGTPRLIEEVPRFAVTWRHVGITDYVTRNGSVDPNIDAYFNWPSFFVLLSFLTEVAGLKSAIHLAGWAPVAFNAIYLAPILGIVGWATRDQRLVWLTVWLFFSWNWIGQDYLSPQATAFFGYLVVVLILVRWFTAGPGATVTAERAQNAARAVKGLLPEGARGRAAAMLRAKGRWARHGEPRAQESLPVQRVLLMGTVILIFAALVPSHQLTPFVVLMTIGTLVLAGRVDARGLPTLMALIVAGWLAFAAVAYLAGHLSVLAGNVGDVQGSVGANVSNRVAGSSDHMLVVYGRLAFTAALWSLAVVGFLRRYRRGRRDVTLALLATAPFIAVPTQPYGGEILLRVFLFTLPAMAFFAAAAVLPSARRVPGLGPTLATLALCTLPLGGMMLARYGNERGESFTHAEVAAVEALYAIAPTGSLLLASGNSTPWKFAHYEEYRHQILLNRPEWQSEDVATAGSARLRRIVETIAAQHDGRGFILLTRSQQADNELLGTVPRNTMPRLEQEISTAPRFVRRFRNRDARIYEILPAPDQAGAP